MLKWMVVVSTSVILVALACGSSAPPPPPAPTPTPQLPAGSVEHKFEVRNFLHQSLTINVGESILWTNREANNVLHSAVHTTRIRGEEIIFSSPNMQNGESFRYTFMAAGQFEYVCRIHPVKMKGIITVVEE